MITQEPEPLLQIPRSASIIFLTSFGKILESTRSPETIKGLGFKLNVEHFALHIFSTPSG